MNFKTKAPLILFALIVMGLVSCGKNNEVDETTNTDNQSNILNSKINVNVSVCENLFCDIEKDLPDIEVKLKRDDSESFYRTASSDGSGEVLFTSINVSSLTVIANYDGQEFQEKINIGRDQVKYIDIRFSPYCELDGSRLVNCGSKIDIEKMSVGQKNLYAMYKSNVKQLDDDKSFHYTGDTLVLEVVKRISDAKWIVKEEFLSETHDSIFEYIINTSPTSSVWEIQTDYFKIYEYSGPRPSNFIPLYGFDFETYQLPLVTDSYNYCEMDEWYTGYCNYEDIPIIKNLKVNGYTYNDDMILIRRSGVDIPQLGIFYNKKEGIVHTYTFGTMQFTYAYGFDLIQ